MPGGYEDRSLWLSFGLRLESGLYSGYLGAKGLPTCSAVHDHDATCYRVVSSRLGVLVSIAKSKH